MEHFLAVDIGNTTIECGVFDGEHLILSWQLASAKARTADECWQSVAFFMRDADLRTNRLKSLALASVVPEHTACFVEMARKRFDPDPLVISADNCPIEVRYRDPRQIGADRLCNAYAGVYHYGAPLVVVDFGTAITLDVVDASGAYLGGVILPGPRTAATGLHSRTAQLPSVSLDFPERIIGDSTEHAIQAGLTWGIVDMIDALLKRIARELGSEPHVVSTGGLGESYALHSGGFTTYHPGLVLEGVRLIHRSIRTGA